MKRSRERVRAYGSSTNRQLVKEREHPFYPTWRSLSDKTRKLISTKLAEQYRSNTWWTDSSLPKGYKSSVKMPRAQAMYSKLFHADRRNTVVSDDEDSDVVILEGRMLELARKRAAELERAASARRLAQAKETAAKEALKELEKKKAAIRRAQQRIAFLRKNLPNIIKLYRKQRAQKLKEYYRSDAFNKRLHAVIKKKEASRREQARLKRELQEKEDRRRKQLEEERIRQKRIREREKAERQRRERERLRREQERLQKEAERRRAAAQKARERAQKAEDSVGKTESEMIKLFVKCVRQKGSGFMNNNKCGVMGNTNFNLSSLSIPKIAKMTRAGTRTKIIDLNIYETKGQKSGKHFYYINGQATLDPNIRRMLPKNIHNRKGKWFGAKPKWMGRSGYYYEKNEQNKTNLLLWLRCALIVNLACDLHNMRDEKAPYLLNPKTVGTLGWEVPCDVPEWVDQTLMLAKVSVNQKKAKLRKTPKDWQAKFNPKIDAQGRITFNKCSISDKAIVGATAHLKIANPTKWKSLLPYCFHLQGKNNKDFFLFNWKFKPKRYEYYSSLEPYEDIVFKQSKSTNIAFQIGWSRHARFAYVDRKLKKMYIYDPWMQSLDRRGARGNSGFEQIKSINNKHGFSTEFVIRKADQGAEGSCVAAAFMRVLMLAQYGKEGATMPIPCYYAILAQRLISMYR